MKTKIGTRGSVLALAQAQEVLAALKVAHDTSHQEFEVCVIKTSGDRIQDRPLAEAGGKGLFTKEIEEALLAREIDLAVHSMKDVPTILPAGLTIACYLPRADVRDAFISTKAASLTQLPAAAVVGTSSLRRQAQVNGCGPTSRSYRCAATSTRACASCRRGQWTPRCSPALGSHAWAFRAASRNPYRSTTCCRRWRKGQSASRSAPTTTGPRTSLRPSTMRRRLWPWPSNVRSSAGSTARARRRSPASPSWWRRIASSSVAKFLRPMVTAPTRPAARAGPRQPSPWPRRQPPSLSLWLGPTSSARSSDAPARHSP